MTPEAQAVLDTAVAVIDAAVAETEAERAYRDFPVRKEAGVEYQAWVAAIARRRAAVDAYTAATADEGVSA